MLPSTAIPMIVHYLVNFYQLEYPSKPSMCNKRIVSGENIIAIASVVFPVGMTINQNEISNNFKLICIAATQMNAHHSVNFDPIQKSFSYLCKHWIVSAKNDKVITSMFVLLGMAKNCKQFLAIFTQILFNCYELQLLK